MNAKRTMQQLRKIPFVREMSSDMGRFLGTLSLPTAALMFLVCVVVVYLLYGLVASLVVGALNVFGFLYMCGFGIYSYLDYRAESKPKGPEARQLRGVQRHITRRFRPVGEALFGTTSDVVPEGAAQGRYSVRSLLRFAGVYGVTALVVFAYLVAGFVPGRGSAVLGLMACASLVGIAWQKRRAAASLFAHEISAGFLSMKQIPFVRAAMFYIPAAYIATILLRYVRIL